MTGTPARPAPALKSNFPRMLLTFEGSPYLYPIDLAAASLRCKRLAIGIFLQIIPRKLELLAHIAAAALHTWVFCEAGVLVNCCHLHVF